MRIVIGRGRNRKTYQLPCGSIIARADAAQVAALHENVCDLVGITRY